MYEEKLAPLLESLTLVDIQTQLEKGIFTSEALTKAYLARIQQFNPLANAIAALNPSAVDDARRADEQRSNGGHDLRIGALHGIPILIKETFNTPGLGMETTAGSHALQGSRPRHEATVVSHLREAGAVILGKTTLSTWSHCRSPRAPAGWSPVYGQTVGAFHVNQSPRGSSSGAAVAISLSLAAAALGADTSGSILFPAERNNVVGFRPTTGLTSRVGIVPVNLDLDTVGLIAKTVPDAVTVLRAICGPDERDPATIGLEAADMAISTPQQDDHLQQNFRLLVVMSAVQAVADNKEVVVAFAQAVTLLSMNGFETGMTDSFRTWQPGAGMCENLYEDVRLKEGLETYLSSLEHNPSNILTLEDLVAFTDRDPRERSDICDSEWLTRARDCKYTSSDTEFLASKSRMEALGDDIREALDRHDFDALVLPTCADVPFDLGRSPVITVPLGFYSERQAVCTEQGGLVYRGPNIPFGIMFVGDRLSEGKLAAMAARFEALTEVWKRGKPII